MKTSVDRSYRLLAAKYMRKQVRQLAEQFEGIRRAEDVECVHRARVASRRLRTALRFFCDCFPRKKLKRWRKQIRGLTDDLGDARDKDVQIGFLCGVLHPLERSDCYPGIARLFVQLERQRELLQPKVIKAIKRLRSGGVLGEIRATIDKELSRKKSLNAGVQSDFVFCQTERHILCHLEEVLGFEDSLADPQQVERHHAMRIAVKHLRYTLEIADPVYDGRLGETIAAIKDAQTLLGEIHDCDVWLEDLGAFAETERRGVLAYFGNEYPFARLAVGIEHLRQERRQRRERAFEELVDHWRDLGREELWEGLRQIIWSRAEQPPAAGQTAEPQQQAAGDSPDHRDGPRPAAEKASPVSTIAGYS